MSSNIEADIQIIKYQIESLQKQLDELKQQTKENYTFWQKHWWKVMVFLSGSGLIAGLAEYMTYLHDAIR